MKNSNAMKSKCLIFCCFIIGLLLGWPIIQVNAQNVSTIISKHQISGIVKDAKGEPVIGASVVEKGTTNGTMTEKMQKESLLLVLVLLKKVRQMVR